ncbi:MAG: hypothetical protein WBG57_12495 [Ornithinimicrobium sp.]
MSDLETAESGKPLRANRRRLALVGAAGVGLLVTASAAWILAVQGPGDEPANQADVETGTNQPRDQVEADTSGSEGTLKQVGTEPAPQVSNVPIEPGTEPVPSDNVDSLDEEPVADLVKKAELVELDEQVAEADKVLADEAQEMDEALAAFEATQGEQAEEFEEVSDVPAPDPGVLDDLEADAESLNGELTESLKGLEKP